MKIDYNVLNEYQLEKIDAKWILNLRSKLNMSRVQFGKLFDQTHAQIYKWENGLSLPTNMVKIQMIRLEKQIATQGGQKVGDTLKGLLIVGGFALVFLWLFGSVDTEE